MPGVLQPHQRRGSCRRPRHVSDQKDKKKLENLLEPKFKRKIFTFGGSRLVFITLFKNMFEMCLKPLRQSYF